MSSALPLFMALFTLGIGSSAFSIDYLEETEMEDAESSRDEYDIEASSQDSGSDFDRDFRPLPPPEIKNPTQTRKLQRTPAVQNTSSKSTSSDREASALPFEAKSKEPPHYELRLSVKDLMVSEGLSKKEVVKYILTRVDKLQTCFPRAIPLEKIDQPVKIQVKATEYDSVRSVSIKSNIPRSSHVAECLRTSLKSVGAKFSSEAAGKYDFELNLAR